MKATLMQFKNCLGVKDVELHPGKIVIIEGKEGIGKTSILEAIQKTFTNKSERPVFVHTEGNKAESYIVLDDGTEIHKIFNKEGKPTTTDVKLNGMRPAGAETFLKSLISENQLNPISLIQMNDKELNEYILKLIPVKISQEDIKEWFGYEMPNIDTNKHGLQVCKEIEKIIYDNRTEINREIKILESEVNTLKEKIPDNYNPEKWRNLHISEIYEKVRKAHDVNNNREKAQNYIETSEQKKQTLIAKCNSEVEIFEEKIKQIQKQIEETKNKYNEQIKEIEENKIKAEEWLKNNPPINIIPLENEMQEAEKMKQIVGLADSLKEKKEVLKQKEDESKKLTEKLEFARNLPTNLLKNVEMPLEGLTIDEAGNVLINNRPIKNLSSGERIKIAVKLAMASAGKLKLILIDGFEKLSPQAQKEFIEEAQKTDFQFILTRVSDGEMKIINEL